MTDRVKTSSFSAPHLQGVECDEEPVNRPACFGDPNKVAQRRPEGLIEPNTECVNCQWVPLCLKQVLQKQGILIPPLKEREPVKRVLNFLKRWSEKKLNNSS